jgi:hypothetical protein
MKKLVLVLIVSVAAGATHLRAPQKTDAEQQTDLLRKLKYLEEVNQSLSVMLFELAAERYAQSTNKWRIFTAHRGGTVRQFTDGKYTVISLPFRERSDEIAVCRYAGLYNSFTQDSADLLVTKAGNYKEAEEVFRLLLHFSRDGIGNEGLASRLKLLEKLQKAEDRHATLAEFGKLYIGVGAHWNLADIDRAKPTLVTNLSEVHLP